MYFNSLTKLEKLETEKILINQKNKKDLVIYFTNYVNRKLIKMLCLHYHELIEKKKEHEEKIFDSGLSYAR